MATYTAAQLYGAGVVGENLSGLKTFTFTNSDASTAYFTLETVRNASGSYSNNAPANAVGSWVVSASMQPGFVTSSQVASLVIPPGTSVVTFTPASAVTGTTYYLRGAGNFSLVIS
jgi:hypothetical protein